ncbi:hypothetical protein OF829_02985 [Sphingomonas sp. LB-2]|uniref:hypothetical protein n=1 Tax=Sphingomonas caeni TaxID=2984949 RepID=UPI002231C9A4|nr:hypothetical protein [Sphingomonas caeni]MCW3846188.1 hypothetical protein [Sphingomonas caeni]
MPDTIVQSASLRAWLESRPREWAQTLALRMALRVLPIVGDEDNSRLHLAAFRALVISWVACRRRVYDFAQTSTTLRAASVEVAPGRAGDAAAAASDAARCAAGFEVTLSASAATEHAVNAVPAIDLWEALNADIATLERSREAGALLCLPLWEASAPNQIVDSWARLTSAMLARDPNAWVWRIWYDRRLIGSDSGFIINPTEDEIIGLQLAIQEDEFWNRDSSEVNADIAHWIKEAASRSFNLEPQNPLATIFLINSEGKIDIDTSAGNVDLNRDEEAREIHGEVLASVSYAIDQCGGNAATATRHALERYGDSLGYSIEDMRPSQIIQRGEVLRQELSARIKNDLDSDLPPIPYTALLALRAVVSAHNQLVALDLSLSRRDEAMAGPDSRRVLISPQEALEIASSIDEMGILTPAAREAIADAASLAPNVPDHHNRRSRQLTDILVNLERVIVNALNSYAPEALGASAIGAIIGIIVTNPVLIGVSAGISTILIVAQLWSSWKNTARSKSRLSAMLDDDARR